MSNFEKNKNLDNETTKYKKKMDSNKSKTKSKSNHKHEFAFCLVKYPTKNIFTGKSEFRICKAGYCPVCGKVNFGCLTESEKDKNGKYRALSDEEILAKYQNLLMFEIESSPFNTKYLSVTNVIQKS